MKYKLIIDKQRDEEITIVAHAPSSLTREIENLVNSYKGLDSLMVQGESETRILPFKEIECITVIDRKIIILNENGQRFSVKKSLRELEEILPSYFIRINKSSLANEHKILRFDASFNGGVDAVFRCGHKDYVSRRCFAEIRRRYEGI